MLSMILNWRVPHESYYSLILSRRYLRRTTSSAFLEGTRCNISTDQDPPKWKLDKAYDITKLSLLGFELSERAFGVVHPVWIKFQASDDLSRLSFSGEDRSPSNHASCTMTVLALPNEHRKVVPSPRTSLTTKMTMELISSCQDYLACVLWWTLSQGWIQFHPS